MRIILIPLLILVLGRVEAQAPTCTGGLGDPIVNITFGAGTGFGAPLPAGITNMQYVATQCPEDGQYTIVHSAVGCYSPTWLNVQRDHTGDPNGYFMLINASYQPSDFYVQTINGLCPGTSYQFAAWVLNMVDVPNEIEPDIVFTILNQADGTVLGTYDTHSIPSSSSVNWVQYGFFFNTPPGVSAVILKMTNNQIGGDGNDLAIDDITFRAAGPTILPSVAGFSTDTISICQSDPQTLGFNATIENCYPTASYQWQQSVDSGVTWTNIPGATAASYSRPSAGTGVFQYRLTVAQVGNIGVSSCEVASAPILVTVIPTPTPGVSIAAAGSDSSCVGAAVNFTATPDSGGVSPLYQWMVDGINAGSGGPTYSTTTLNDGDVISCVMTSDAVCVLNPVVTSNTLSFTVTAIPTTSVSIAASAISICQDSIVVFTATPVNGGVAPSYQWAVNGAAVGGGAAGGGTAGGQSAVFSDSRLENGDVVTCTMTSSLVCAQPVGTTPITMVVYPLPIIQLTPDTVIAGGHGLQLSPFIGGTIDSVRWSPATGLDNPGIPDPVAVPVGSTTYTLTVVTDKGCVAMASEAVGVYYQLAMPGAFTPNGDGRNDVFRVPPAVPVVVHLLAVYNRDGLCVYSAGGAAAGWDGKFGGHLQPAGQYVWVLDYVNPLTQREEAAKGTVMLVR